MSDAEAARPDRPALLDVQGLSVVFKGARGRAPVRAVDGVSFQIAEGETLGLVGESGSGKTTIGRAILGLVPVSEGALFLSGEDITAASHARRRRLSSDLQAVFQDPYSSLNPTRTIRQTLAETLRAQGERDKDRIEQRVRVMLEHVGLAADSASRYPAAFSGGQRQRISIARALMASPRLVICDEPTSALDLSVQAQVLNLLRSLQDELALSYLFVSHDLAVVRHLSHRIVVLYHGRIMESGPAEAVYSRPTHPYTQALVASAPVPDPDEQRMRRAARTSSSSGGQPRSVDACPFAARCPHAQDVCRTSRPQLQAARGTMVACHLWSEIGDHATPVELVSLAPRRIVAQIVDN